MSGATPARMRPPLRLPDPDALTDPRSLEPLFGPIAELVTTPMRDPTGFSNSMHAWVDLRLEDGSVRRLVLKRTDLGHDWLGRRGGDTGREARMLEEPAFARVWSVFTCPYLAFARSRDRIAMLMVDLGEHLLPDQRAPLTDVQEGVLIESLARLHARFWESEALGLEWLARPEHSLDLIGPAVLDDGSVLAAAPDSVREAIPRGWRRVREVLSTRATAWLFRPAKECVASWERLPRTLLHGDCKVANFALLPGGRVAAFDWPMLGAGPCGVELGWYVAVNATRLTGSKEDLMRRYRAALESARGNALDEGTWKGLRDASVLAGARMLLWSKAVALDSGRDEARVEWAWWAERIEALAGK